MKFKWILMMGDGICKTRIYRQIIPCAGFKTMFNFKLKKEMTSYKVMT